MKMMNSKRLLNLEFVDFLVVHSSATPVSMDIGVKEIDEWHRDKGWSGIGYHFVVRRNGDVQLGRPMNKQGAHVLRHNQNTLGICMIGGIDVEGDPENNFTDEQFKSLYVLVQLLSHFYFVENQMTEVPKVCGHRDFEGTKTLCPSFDVKTWWNDERKHKTI